MQIRNCEWCVKEGCCNYNLKKELEEIKAKIENIPNDETTKPIGTYDYCLGAENERKVVLEILNNRISELKGENKQSRCNNCLNNTDELSGECYECVKGIEDWYEPTSELKGNNKDNWFAEMEEAEKRYEHEKWVESLEKGEQE